MDKFLERLCKIPMTGDQLIKLAEGNVKIVTNSEIGNYRSIDELLKPYGAVIILYEKKKNMGHWVLLLDNEKNIEYFDPYGLPIDYPLKLFGGKPFLSQLLLNSGYKIIYNGYQLQKFSKDVSSCGRWVAMRLILRTWPLNEFIKAFKNTKLQADNLVTAFTSFVN